MEREKTVMKRVYIAGAYNADNVVSVLDNMRRGMRAATEVLLKGYAPFVPWFDYHFNLMLRECEELLLTDFYDYSIAWLEVSDAVLALPSCGGSNGAQMELERAEELGIPVFYSLLDLIGGLER